MERRFKVEKTILFTLGFCASSKIILLILTTSVWGNTVSDWKKSRVEIECKNIECTNADENRSVLKSKQESWDWDRNLDPNPMFVLYNSRELNRYLNKYKVKRLQSEELQSKEFQSKKLQFQELEIADSYLDLDPQIIEESPVLQRWKRRIPNVLSDIYNDPSFRTKIRAGYSVYPNSNIGAYFSIEDIFINSTRLTLRGDYQTAFSGEYRSYGTDLQYYLRPMGNYINIATLTGYRYLENHDYSTSGINLGIKFILVLSRGGGADISLTQSWVSPLGKREAGFTTLSFGYAIAPDLRLSTEIQQQNTRDRKDRRFGIVMELMQ